YENGLVKPLTSSRYLPFLSFSYYNLELAIPSLLTAISSDRRNRFDDRGNYTYPVRKVSKADNREKAYPERTIDNPLLDEMLSLADEYGSKTVFYIAPYQYEDYTLRSGFDDVRILDHSGKLQADSLFFDYHHVNSNGRRVATELFIDDLRGILE
ncbi:MAG: hypothetical protein WBG62_23005, partial [Cyclobacteriaceae bacterium]